MIPGRVVARFALLGLAACTVGGTPVDRSDAEGARNFDVPQDPASRTAWEEARQALARGDRGAALPVLRRLVEASPDFVRAHLAYQDAARSLGGAAQTAMIEFYRQMPDRGSPVAPYCRARLADTSYAQGAALRAILAAHPDFSWAHLSQARLLRHKGQLLQAVDSFAVALRWDPTLVEAHLERAQLLAELDRGEEAAVDFEAYLAKMPGDDSVRLAFAELSIYRLGRIDQGKALLARLDPSRRSDLAVRLDRAAAAWLGHDPKPAVQEYLEVLSSHPDEARALLNVGLLYYEVVPRGEAERSLYWPKARAAFQLFLAAPAPRDGHEQFERTLGVPYRLEVIAEALGPAPGHKPELADLAWPESK